MQFSIIVLRRTMRSLDDLSDDEITKRLDRVSAEKERYGMTKREAIQELINMDQSLSHNYGVVSLDNALEVIEGTPGLLRLLYEIAVDRMDENQVGQLLFSPLDEEQRVEIVREMIYDDGRLPKELYDMSRARSP